MKYREKIKRWRDEISRNPANIIEDPELFLYYQRLREEKIYISKLSKDCIIEYAKRLLQKYEGVFTEKREDHIVAYYNHYRCGNYIASDFVEFDDLSFRINQKPGTIANTYLWVRYVYANLPEEDKIGYARKWNSYLEDKISNGELSLSDLMTPKGKYYFLPSEKVNKEECYIKN